MANDLQYKLIDYMDAATDLAESVIQDLRRNGKVSEETVIKLSQFRAKAEAIQKFVDMINKEVRNLQ